MSENQPLDIWTSLQISPTEPINKQQDLIKRKKRPDQEDKLKCQAIATGVWEEYPLDYKYMKMHPEIKKIVGRQYKGKNTLHDWLAEVAPEQIKRVGIRSKDYIKEQLAICKKLNIEVPKK